MAPQFTTESELADMLGVSVLKVTEWRRRYSWPCVKIGRQVRFTEADIRAIEAQHHVVTARDVGLPGQTPISTQRSA